MIKENYLQTFILDDLGNEHWYFGPPQIKGDDSLPTLAFSQDFHSKTMNKQANIKIYTALGTSNGTSRSYSISKYNISLVKLSIVDILYIYKSYTINFWWFYFP